ncbi:L-lactate dehydrogenase [Candidatus Clostridium helianthi]|uniref:L-lactate dehydrogenase n=1 Tax=Candidatus Clostridium helianthi TaxID=3381660 RepID=A0ABW8SBJ9_9CLOT
MIIKTKKIGIIGIGHVGSHVASSIITQGVCDELVLIDIDKKKSESHAQDLSDTIVYMPHRVNVISGTYKDIIDADILVISASKPIFKEDRLEELENNIEVIDEIVPHIKESGFSGIILSISNPCDIIAYYVKKQTGLNVIGTGTALDSARLRCEISRRTGLDSKSIQAYCLGEHGDSQMVPWSTVTVNGKPLLELMKEKSETYGKINLKEIAFKTMKAGWSILLGKGSTEFGIGATTTEIIKAIFHNEKKVLPCSAMLNGSYGQADIYASVPCVIGKNGVEEIIEIHLTKEEQDDFVNSCSVIKRNIDKIYNI